jgi:hypothetical protein
VITTAIPSVTISNIVTGVVVVGCLLFLIITELTDDNRRQSIVTFGQRVGVFTVPLFSVIAYIVIIWGAKILTG